MSDDKKTYEEVVAKLEDWLRPDRDPPISPRPWRMWGSELRCPKPGVDPNDGNLDHSDPVAWFQLHPNRHGGSHVADLDFVASLVSALPSLIEAYHANQEEIARLKADVQKRDEHMAECPAGVELLVAKAANRDLHDRIASLHGLLREAHTLYRCVIRDILKDEPQQEADELFTRIDTAVPREGER
jgi:hypothetical protein